MLETLIREVSARLGLGDQARPLIQMLVAYIANPATGGLSGFLDKFRSAGMGDLVQSWLGSSSTPQAPSASQLDTVMGAGDGALNKISTRLGLPYDKVGTAVAALLPMLVSRMTPGGAVPNVLPTEFTDIARDGQSLLGMGKEPAARVTAAAGAAAAPVAAAASGGMGKWLPWLIAALVVIFGISYCAKGKQPAEAPAGAPAPAAMPAPVAPEPAPAPAAAAPTSDSFTAPEGAGVLVGVLQDMPLLRVFFDSGKIDVAPEFADKATAVVAYLQGNPDVKAVISGFNDPTGDPVKNAELSKRRAEAVQAALVAAGVPGERTALEKPAETTDTGATNAASRRVDVVLRK